MPHAARDAAELGDGVELQVNDDHREVAVAQDEVGGLQRLGGGTASHPQEPGQHGGFLCVDVEAVGPVDQGHEAPGAREAAQEGVQHLGRPGHRTVAHQLGEVAPGQAAAEERVEGRDAGGDDGVARPPMDAQAHVGHARPQQFLQTRDAAFSHGLWLVSSPPGRSPYRGASRMEWKPCTRGGTTAVRPRGRTLDTALGRPAGRVPSRGGSDAACPVRRVRGPGLQNRIRPWKRSLTAVSRLTRPLTAVPRSPGTTRPGRAPPRRAEPPRTAP
jgi:hypothetical protein